MPKSAQHFLFERLENFNHTEFIDVKKLMQKGEATIEHIMPQTLTPEWKAELGENAETIHELFLHRIQTGPIIVYPSIIQSLKV